MRRERGTYHWLRYFVELCADGETGKKREGEEKQGGAGGKGRGTRRAEGEKEGEREEDIRRRAEKDVFE